MNGREVEEVLEALWICSENRNHDLQALKEECDVPVDEGLLSAWEADQLVVHGGGMVLLTRAGRGRAADWGVAVPAASSPGVQNARPPDWGVAVPAANAAAGSKPALQQRPPVGRSPILPPGPSVCVRGSGGLLGMNIGHF